MANPNVVVDIPVATSMLSKVAIDNKGRTWVTANSSKSISVFAPDGKLRFKVGPFKDSTPQLGAIRCLFHEPTKDEMYTLETSEHRIRVFDREGQLLRTFGSKEVLTAGTMSARSIVVDAKRGRCYVTFALRSYIKVIDLEGRELHDIFLEQTPWSMALLSNGNLVVSSSYSNTVNSSVLSLNVLDPTGKKLFSKNLPQPRGEVPQVFVTSIFVSQLGQIFVGTNTPHLFVFTEGLELLEIANLDFSKTSAESSWKTEKRVQITDLCYFEGKGDPTVSRLAITATFTIKKSTHGNAGESVLVFKDFHSSLGSYKRRTRTMVEPKEKAVFTTIGDPTWADFFGDYDAFDDAPKVLKMKKDGTLFASPASGDKVVTMVGDKFPELVISEDFKIAGFAFDEENDFIFVASKDEESFIVGATIGTYSEGENKGLDVLYEETERFPVDGNVSDLAIDSGNGRSALLFAADDLRHCINVFSIRKKGSIISLVFERRFGFVSAAGGGIFAPYIVRLLSNGDVAVVGKSDDVHISIFSRESVLLKVISLDYAKKDEKVTLFIDSLDRLYVASRGTLYIHARDGTIITTVQIEGMKIIHACYHETHQPWSSRLVLFAYIPGETEYQLLECKDFYKQRIAGTTVVGDLLYSRGYSVKNTAPMQIKRFLDIYSRIPFDVQNTVASKLYGYRDLMIGEDRAQNAIRNAYYTSEQAIGVKRTLGTSKMAQVTEEFVRAMQEKKKAESGDIVGRK